MEFLHGVPAARCGAVQPAMTEIVDSCCRIGRFAQSISGQTIAAKKKLTWVGKIRLIPPVAQIAQSVEQRIENPRVGGSIPPLGTINFSVLILHIISLKAETRFAMKMPL